MEDVNDFHTYSFIKSISVHSNAEALFDVHPYKFHFGDLRNETIQMIL